MRSVAVAAPAPELTPSRVNAAGRRLRGWVLSDDLDVEEAVERDITVLFEFRAAHQVPLNKATMGLRDAVAREGCEIEVSQRLKRWTTILDKLVRYPTMGLANMQDIGGCRAVLNGIEEVRRVQRRLSRRRRRLPVRVYDYIDEPKESGYRGIHLIVQYDTRKIEIQLRTRVMHEWAIYVERLSGRLQTDLKSNRGPAELLEWLEAVSEAMAIEEVGETVEAPLLERIAKLREGALGYLGGHR
jgi:putative GTP pyrophosphokinase